tara:strand:- start:3356 stop:4006 length:651 start_codon:yes stop_codon:yes gene_type:complete
MKAALATLALLPFASALGPCDLGYDEAGKQVAHEAFRGEVNNGAWVERGYIGIQNGHRMFRRDVCIRLTVEDTIPVMEYIGNDGDTNQATCENNGDYWGDSYVSTIHWGFSPANSLIPCTDGVCHWGFRFENQFIMYESDEAQINDGWLWRPDTTTPDAVLPPGCPVLGCTDDDYEEYNPAATADDGSCSALADKCAEAIANADNTAYQGEGCCAC